mmetsp:Transcript_32697/g.68770  ORF Transcript_32697/g.68770 Transcript_32697/m.68770 type:complete len:612 (+) Transcript_32697:98-1933(+)|eukprot:CAMPEP_0172304122 /NCGR_PEP_ID=MMETSP1058-20130122/5564_1 /TAXON_ID=83371 /ORGANISM="Detonula confervacea, Strain CCMP 353" /LENGTH=611 /DNA_ID=CAMNT_0013015213 /DNA_START=38 /DNA_END=1873 /DNA_ORIENTATION=+
MLLSPPPSKRTAGLGHRRKPHSPSRRSCASWSSMHAFIILLSLGVLIISPCYCSSNASAGPKNNKLQITARTSALQSHYRLLAKVSTEGEDEDVPLVIYDGQDMIGDNVQKQEKEEKEDIPLVVYDGQDMVYRGEDEMMDSAEMEEADEEQYGSMEDELLQGMEEEEGTECETSSAADSDNDCENAGGFCQLATGICNNNSASHTGVCATLPEMCAEMYQPVCGCDGRDYTNECKAHSKGVSVSQIGKCDENLPGKTAAPQVQTMKAAEIQEAEDKAAPQARSEYEIIMDSAEMKEAEEADAEQYGTVEEFEEMLEEIEEEADAVEKDDEQDELESDSVETEETDVQEEAGELLKEAKSEANNEEDSTSTTLSSSKSYSIDTNRSAWVAHGAIATIAFGLLVPATISSAFFRDLIPTYWIYIHVCVNVLIFAMTFFAVGIAFATMNGMVAAGGEGHFQEMHHIVGLMLLLLVSFQTANGFLRPPREFITDDEHDKTPGAILRSTVKDKSITARTLWHLVHSVSGLLAFGLGAYQVQSGLGLFAKRFGSPDWSSVYTGYILWLSAVIVIAKLWMKWKDRQMKKNHLEFQMGRGSNVGYDPENDFAVAQFETV